MGVAQAATEAILKVILWIVKQNPFKTRQAKLVATITTKVAELVSSSIGGSHRITVGDICVIQRFVI